MKTTFRSSINLFVTFVVLITMLFSGLQPSPVSAQAQDGIQREYNTETGRITLITGADHKPISVLGTNQLDLTPEAQSMALVQHFASEFGLTNPPEELQLSKIDQPSADRVVSKYQQVYQGVPVMAGELIVNASKTGELLSMNGEVSPGLSLDTTPKLPVKAAIDMAQQGMVKWYGGNREEYASIKSSLWIFDESLLRPSIRPVALVWRIEMASAQQDRPIRELVLVDAKTGNISLHFSQIDTAWTTRTTEQNVPAPSQTNLTNPAVSVPPSQATNNGQSDGTNSGAFPSPANYYVNISTGADNNSCTTASDPCQNIQEAVNKASSGDFIYVASGTYVFSSNESPNVVIVNKDVTLSGGWDADFISQNGASIIDGANTNNGILSNSGTIVVENFIIENAKSESGGAIFIENGNFTLKKSTLRNNIAATSGGGIFFHNETLTIINSTISGNTAYFGGGISGSNSVFSSLTVQNSTIANNSAYIGGGIYQTTGTNSLTNTILANNSSTLADPDCHGIFSTADYNIISDPTGCIIQSGSHNINVDPHMDANLTGDMLVHMLLAGSPAINTGTASVCPSTDQRGTSRPSGSGCDIGSVEYVSNGAKSINIFSGSNQDGPINTVFDSNLIVLVVDENDVPVSGVSVIFTAPSSGASGVFTNSGTDSTIATTGVDGIATSSTFTANNVEGNYIIAASAAGFNPVQFQITNYSSGSDPKGRYVSSTGSDSFPTTCNSISSPCLTINKAIESAAIGDRVYVSAGNYQGSGNEVVLINKRVALSGGWDENFSAQDGTSIIDGQGARRGLTTSVFGIPVVVDRFTILNGFDNAQGGGGIYNYGTLILNNSIVSGNVSGNQGGGILNGGRLTLNNTAVSGNRAGTLSSGSTGGGIQNSDGPVILNNSAVTGNILYNGSLGSGIYNYGGLFELNNSTVGGNTGGQGIANMASNFTLNNSTVSFNSGGGINNINYNWAPPSTVTMRNSILANNTISGAGSDCTGNIISAGHNLIGTTSGCNFMSGAADLLNINPALNSTLMGVPAYYALLSSSPAIDAGDPSTCLGTDQRGKTRPVGAACDIGAYEYDNTPPGPAAKLVFVSGSGQQTAPLWAFPLRLQVAILDSHGIPVPNVSVVFSAPETGASGIFADSRKNTTTIRSNVSGIATAPIFTANNQSGDYNVTASIPGLAGSVIFSLTNLKSYYVSTTGSDLNSCTNPDSPCLTINGAMEKATNGDTIEVAVGTYTGSGNEVLLIEKSITLLGGWNSNFTAQIGMSIIDGQKLRHGITIPDQNTNALLDHFTIQNGFGVTIQTGMGGGINNFGTLTLNNSLVTGNVSSWMGGGIYNHNTLTLNNTTVSGNSAGSGGSGGGGGAGIENYSGTATLNNSTVSDNTIIGSLQGSGISNFDTVILNNSTVSGNKGGSGSGIYVFVGSVELNNSTVSNNQYEGIVNQAGQVRLHNTIIAGNGSKDCFNDTSYSGTITSYGYNLIGDGTFCAFALNTGDQVGTSVNPINPHLTPLQNNGGPTFTHALVDGSPAISAGDPAICPTIDQRGVARPVGAHCDIGAYEGSVPWAPYPLVSTFTNGRSYYLPGTFLCNQTQPNCTNNDNPHADAAHKYALGTYNLYITKHGRDSLDNNGMTIKSTVHYCDVSICPYANAFWNGAQMIYGDAYGYPLADDVVAHELTHGVTQYSSDLFYFYQSGAINESLSDIWGEYYDQANGLGTDTTAVKWLLGEDVTGKGAMRSMSNPPAFGDPDKMTSPYYDTSDLDAGGVHTNSGVNNKAVFLMVAGGSFNGKTVTALGWDKTAAIYYEVNTNLLSSGSDYSDLYYAVQQACTNLMGKSGITTSDCQQVKNALTAVEMNVQPIGGFNPDAPICAAGKYASPLFQDDMENGLSKWSTAGAWSLDTGFASSPKHMMYGDDYYSNKDSTMTMATGIALPPTSTVYLYFKHAFAFEYDANGYYDGGVLEYSYNNGATWVDAAPLFSDGKNYKGIVSNYPGTTNALKGRSAFVGDSHGYVSSRYNLTPLAGQTIKFRWRFATDNAYYYLGWMVDDVQIYTCGSTPPPPPPGSEPIVKSSVRADIDPNSAASVKFTVKFSQTVTGVDASDFSLTTNGVLGAKVGAVSGSGSTYTVTVNSGSGSGMIQLNVLDNDTILNGSAIPLGGAGVGNGNFTSGENYTIRKTWIFGDVPDTYWANGFIERLYNDNITGGCSSVPLLYCPNSSVTRAQMAVFLLRAKHGPAYTPPSATGTVYKDIPASYWAAKWIEQLAAEGITGGCGNNNYCPENVVTRDQMAVFLLRGKHGSPYTPPEMTGTLFTDVPTGYWAGAWIEALANEGVTGGCGGGNYCPAAVVTRDQMAVFLIKAFNLP